MRFFVLAIVIVLIGVSTYSRLDRNPMSSVIKLPGRVPGKFYNATDLAFSKNQDTLYYNQQHFSGYVYALYPNNDTAFIIGYLNGLQEGNTRRWYPNKQLAEDRFYIQGGKEGIHKGWWQDGKPKFVYHFANDEFEGLVTEWFNTGLLFRLLHYQKGHEVGSEKIWWDNGRIRANYVMVNGQRFGLSGQKLCINDIGKVRADSLILSQEK